MKAHPPDLPPSYRSEYFEEIDSTNSEALRRARAGEAAGLWIFAGRQKDGRGRDGRSWVSEPGNLHASLLLRPACNLQTAAQLSLVAGVAALDAVRALTVSTGKKLDLGLKWPNDLLLDGEKLGGILLESSAAPSSEDIYVIIGTGLNLASHPELDDIVATNLALYGHNAAPHDALIALAWSTQKWLDIWHQGENFNCIRKEWLARAIGLGKSIRVKHGGEEIRGLFDSLDENGALLLDCGEDGLRRITVGDVFF